MKNYGRALVLLLGLVLLSQAAMAQDAQGRVLPAPWTSRVGTQLMYFYEDGVANSARGKFKSYLTIVNTSLTTGVDVHFQFYVVDKDGACTELFDFVDYLTPGQRSIIDPENVVGTGELGFVGKATDSRHILTATPVAVWGINSYSAIDLRARSFNHLSGQIWVTDVAKTATWMTNAVSRMAVNVFGGALDDGFLIDNVNGFFQTFQPLYLVVNSFFPTIGPAKVEGGVVFGNRLTLFTWQDQYTNEQVMFRLIAGGATLNSFVFDDNENAFSVPPRTITCIKEFTIAPDVPPGCSGGSICSGGNFSDFLGSAITGAVNNTGGWVRMRVDGYGTSNRTNIIGWFSQNLQGYGGGDYLIGIGRVNAGGTTITHSTGYGANAATKTSTAISDPDLIKY